MATKKLINKTLRQIANTLPAATYEAKNYGYTDHIRVNHHRRMKRALSRYGTQGVVKYIDANSTAPGYGGNSKRMTLPFLLIMKLLSILGIKQTKQESL